MTRTILPRAFSGRTTRDPWPWEKPHQTLAQEAAEEGIVLLKNDGVLPLDAGQPVALYGTGAVMTVKGGTGSGDVNERWSISVEQGMRNAGFSLTTDAWLRDCETTFTKAREEWRDCIYAKARKKDGPLAFFDAYSTTPFQYPAGPAIPEEKGRTAVYVISRIAGEGADRSRGKGDYLLLDAEMEHLGILCRNYDHVIVILNAGGVMDCSFLDDFPGIGALLVVSQPGMMGGNAVASILSGKVSPSGHLTDTWACRYDDYPTSAHFSHNDGDTKHGLYTEGIYVGYRYFDTFGVPARFGFGDGLSYTCFSLSLSSLSASPDGLVQASVCVRNTGKCAGKAVAQLYAQLPTGRLEKEYRRLVAYGKTALLAPGERTQLILTVTPDALASFDDTLPAWVLEKGLYGLYLGESLKDSRLCGSLNLPGETVLQPLEHVCQPRVPVDEIHPDPALALQRYQDLEKAAASLPCLRYAPPSRPAVCYTEQEADPEALALASTLTPEQLIALCVGDPSRGQDSMLGSAGKTVPGAAGETSACAMEQGVAPLILADGPAGLRLRQVYHVQGEIIQHAPLAMAVEHSFLYDGPPPEGEEHYQFCTAFPVGTLLAQTWNTELVRTVGLAVGLEMETYNITLWLAPGMNIHRDPLCGRNFEYYSEDPLVSGTMAAAMTLGVQAHPGCGTTIKHYACNNQEDDRLDTDSILSERALREIYLRGFGLAIALSHPLSIMTSYNMINGVHSANNYDLCTRVARCEFGFDGVIMTDWTTTNHDESCTAAGCVMAGNDLVMPGLDSDMESIRKALEEGRLTPERVRTCAAHLIRVVLLSRCYEP